MLSSGDPNDPKRRVIVSDADFASVPGDVEQVRFRHGGSRLGPIQAVPWSASP
jgi:hypothetical protein